MKNFLPLLLLFLTGSCAVSKNYNPAKKFPPSELKEDYAIFRNTLEELHPSLYWYTSRDSLDYYFSLGEAKLNDSLPEFKFRNILGYVMAQIHCGHTTVRSSKAAVNLAGRTRSISFPLSIKVWDDTAVITSNLNRRDSSVVIGSILKSIDGQPVPLIIDSLFKYITADGYNNTYKYQLLSNGNSFRNLYGGVFGLKLKTPIEFIDTAGNLKRTTIGLYTPVVDTGRRRQPPPPPISKRERRRRALESSRSLRIDTALHTAFMDVNTFSKRNKLRGFFRRSFRQLRKEHIPNLVVDMRYNGGGSVILSNLLTKYIADKPFKIADTLYAVRRKSRYGKYQDNYLLNRLFFMFMTRRKSDGNFHYTFFENKYFKPRKKNHYEGTIYIMTGGYTFSAAALFTKSLKDQKDVIIVGEETGGGAYGNSAMMIANATLPHTKVRLNIPLFRLVIDRNEQKGHGIQPEVEVKPSVQAIRHNADYKVDKVIELIREKNKN